MPPFVPVLSAPPAPGPSSSDSRLDSLAASAWTEACINCNRPLNCCGAGPGQYDLDSGAHCCSPNCRWSAMIGRPRRRGALGRNGAGRNGKLRRSRQRPSAADNEVDLSASSPTGANDDLQTEQDLQANARKPNAGVGPFEIWLMDEPFFALTVS